jgi:LCP family protein required for cell wall assembly
MRTTLKRGIGRGADPTNGNGRAVYPPGIASPMTRYRQPPPSRRSGWAAAARVFGWFVLCLLVLVVGLAGGAYLWAHESVAATAPKSADVKRAARELIAPLPGKPATALVIGYDHRAGEESGLPSRSDTLMLLRADPANKTLSMMSFPRDLVVPIRCPGHATYTDRINAAYSECGAKGSLDTIRGLTRIQINYLITVNFRGFKQVVDQLGGVWIDVDHRYFNDNAGLGTGYTYATIDLHPGYQKLSGSQALDYVRYRHTDSDLYRVARQQAFVKAAKQQLNQFSPFKLPRLVGAVTDNTEIAEAGAKGINIGTLKSYAQFLYALPAGHFFQPKIDNLTETGLDNAELAASSQSIDDAIQQFLHPDVEASETATNVALGRKPKKKPGLRPSQVTVSVLNGNGVAGSATNAAYLLGQRGYRIVLPADQKPANAPTWNYFHTKVYYRPGVAGAQGAAKVIANEFGAADVQKLPASLDSLSNGAAETVVVGQTFHGDLAPAVVDQTPKRQPPAVSTNPGLTLPLLRDVRRRVPFKLQVPAIVERHSTLTSAEPVRVYKLNKDHKAVRLSFWTGVNGDYWGVEETDWNDAPVLNNPNTSATIGGRHFQLYYVGGKLHMVALRANGATYWVVNTLLDSLSNETMLAIAKGLRPVGR